MKKILLAIALASQAQIAPAANPLVEMKPSAGTIVLELYRWRSRRTRRMQLRIRRGAGLPLPADVAQRAARVQGRRTVEELHAWRGQEGEGELPRRDPARRAFPCYSKPTMWQIRDTLMPVMMTHQYAVPCFDAAKITEATVQARAEMHKIVNGLRKLGGPWEGLQSAATAEQIGVRDGRRIAGRYIGNKDDLVAGARYDDAVVRPTFSVDIHALSAEANKTAAYSNAGVKVKPYDIPLRALIARADALCAAGHTIKRPAVWRSVFLHPAEANINLSYGDETDSKLNFNFNLESPQHQELQQRLARANEFFSISQTLLSTMKVQNAEGGEGND